ncbi:response regulator [Deinococcus hopiensis]|uniref:Response regulator containing a CheY-like receiver domain and an HTH DNA-binding domain n=1 Tax=Deinococcus hopiensis KR-140 TaxID=695939 RepID=A0A1W1VUW9_9DEIO|nr:response regulator [Deinococcus hopiensis]SMB97063.1 Response regulator containing a CheY-like receiver domain and an HTH DNA-binding domain [Deinococcus hopiensis KR-140]
MTDVLLVEDHGADVELVREAVASFEGEVTLHVVQDGDEALRFLRRVGAYAGVSPVQLVLLDANTPRMNACQVLTELRADAATRELPVVVFSSSARLKDIQACTEAGASGYAVTPSDFLGFVMVVHGFLQDWRKAVAHPDGLTDLPRR